VGTTKLTRKEISADPIHDALVETVDFLRAHAMILCLAGAGLLVIMLGTYFGLRYLDTRDATAQQELGKGMDYYHGTVDGATAKDDPYAAGPAPVFKSEEAKFRAASAIFSSVSSRSGSSKIAVMARYYLGLCQKQLGQKSEAIATLEAVGNNTSDRTVGFLAKKVLAGYYVETGDAKKGLDLLQNILKDPQCDLPREGLLIDVSRAYMAMGKREEAVKTLEEAQASGAGGMLQSLVFQELSHIQSGTGK
jgi:predicted negative regulator of RcsB-dependent stress response